MTQRAIERSMLWILLCEHIQNEVIWKQKGVKNMNIKSKSSARLDTSKGLQTTDGPMQLLSGVRETENNHLFNFHNEGKTKLFSDLSQHWEDKWDGE